MGKRGGSSGATGGGGGGKTTDIKNAIKEEIDSSGYDVNLDDAPGIDKMISDEMDAGTPKAAIVKAGVDLATAKDMDAPEIKVFRVSNGYAAGMVGATDTKLVVGEISGGTFSGAAITKAGNLYPVTRKISKSDIVKTYGYN